MTSNDHEERLTRYLLGLATDEEREHLEVELLADDDVFARLAVAEDDLIDAYVRGELAGEQRELFEQRWLSSPRRQARVEFARQLEVVSNAEPECSPSVLPSQPAAGQPTVWQPTVWQRCTAWLSPSGGYLQPIAALAVFGFIVAGGLIVGLKADNADLRSRLAVLETARQAALSAGASIQSEGIRPVYLLKPITRSGGVQKLAVSAHESMIRLRADVDDSQSYRSIEAALGRKRDETIATWQLDSGPQVVVELPTSQLGIESETPGGRFHLTLRGRDEAGNTSLVGYYELEIDFYGGFSEVP